MDRSVGVLLAKSAHQHLCSGRSKKTSHVLNSQRVHAHVYEFISQLHVVFKIVLALGRVSNITSIGHGTLNKSSSGTSSVYAQLEIVNVVQRIKHTENINSTSMCLLAELVNNVVRVVCVSNSISTTEQHLEGNIRCFLPQALQSLPRTFVQKSHGDIKGSTTPHFKREGIRQGSVGVFSASFEFLSTHTSCKERLVSITPSGIHKKEALVLTNCLSITLRSLLQENLAHTTSASSTLWKN
mmetsp:Transcript_5723/g.8090  ORF Transcript_5723/g.8090 Transcript_5723/m.8090 type:complete len:241 (-) Transcript_5723:346-1068(-)